MSLAVGQYLWKMGRLFVCGGAAMLTAGYVIMTNQPPRNPLMEEMSYPYKEPYVETETGARSPLKDSVEPVEEVEMKTSAK